jgi:secreted protein with Ig-like and vWFA domain
MAEVPAARVRQDAGQRILHEVATLGEEGDATERRYGLEPVDPSVLRLLSLASAAETGY